MSLRDWLLVLLLGILWGSVFLLNEVLLLGMSPLWIGAGRSLVAAAGCWVFVFAARLPLPPRPVAYLQMMGLGVLAYAVPYSLFPIAQQHLTSGVTAIVNSTVPIITILISHFWPGAEKATRQKALGVVAGFAGVYILASPGIALGEGNQVLGVVLTLLGTASYAFTLVLTPYVVRIHPSIFAATAITGAALVSVPVALWGEGPPPMPGADILLVLVALGLVATALPLQIMYRMLPRTGATNFSTIIFIVPVWAVALGVVFLDEPLLPSHIVGMLCIFAGLLIIDGRLMRRLLRRPPGPISS